MIDDTITWSRTRTETVEKFGGELPRANTEAFIIDIFEINPKAVLKAIEHITAAYKNGKVRSPWAVLKAELQGAKDPLREAEVTSPHKREDAIRLAEAWIRNTGLHYETADEILEELFTNQQGRLHAWADDEALVKRTVAFWRQHRPAGVRVEQDDLKRAAEWVEKRAAAQQTRLDNRRAKHLVQKWVDAGLTQEQIETNLRYAIRDQDMRYELVDHAADLKANITQSSTTTTIQPDAHAEQPVGAP